MIGLVGSTPRLEMSMHELGAARPFGKHIVMRPPNSAAEWTHIEQAFSKLDESERRRLHETRKRHKAAMLLLHELGHTLGAIHVKSPKAIMSRAYSDDVVGFSEPTLALLRVSIAHKKVPVADRDERGLAQGVLGALDRQRDADFVEGERASLEASLRGASPNAPSDRVQRAERELAAGDAESAWRTAEPLFTAHPDDPAIQDLRCRIATRRGGDYATVKRECQHALELTPAPPAFE